MTLANSSTEAAETLCARYRSENGLDGAEVNHLSRIVVPAGRIDSIQMPRRLGDIVRNELEQRKIRTPIILNKTTGYLMFITNAAPADDSRPVHMLRMGGDAETGVPVSLRRDAGLYRNAAIRTVRGVMVPLPGPNDEIRSWLEEPVGRRRADFDTVAEITVSAGDKLAGLRHG
ncbi:hypothetical protein IU450_33715 [Nocardia abscessus]|uniref:hypothetical protein n=1 Tax=Nocardia abscessus TaxID=120957 RepID=UPI001892E57D|nr:hypothetical protein [Nocardia abscessus]MBF6340815.1 hypothetical protein [Nocardia abscessus]